MASQIDEEGPYNLVARGSAANWRAQILQAETEFRALTNTRPSNSRAAGARKSRCVRPHEVQLQAQPAPTARPEWHEAKVLLTAKAQNLRRLVKFLCRLPPIAGTTCPA
jgi:hypothetical protein